MQGKLFYWDGIVANVGLAERHASVLNKLQTGNYKEADLNLKKLPGHQLYSVRVNCADRLLFTTVKAENGLRCLLLLEEIKNHDYQKSRFMKPSVLSAFIENKAATAIQKALSEENFIAYEGEKIVDNFYPDEAAPMSFYKQFIEFSESQQNAVKHFLPFLMMGAAGSGKSCIAIALLASKVKEYLNHETNGICLYITQSDNLAIEMRRLWQSHPSAQDNIKVEIRTYKDLVLADNTVLQAFEEVNKDVFESWTQTYIQKSKKVKKDNSNPNMFARFIAKKNALYQEFRILSVYHPNNQKAYMSLGNRQSLFTHNTERQWIWVAYGKYQDFLKQQHQYDLSFIPLVTECKYAFIVADEAQDFSHLQLQTIFQSTEAEQAVFCIDSHQSIKDDLSKRIFLESLSKNMGRVELPGSYRCPRSVVALGNQVLAIKYQLTGGIADKKESSMISTNRSQDKGSLQWHEPSTEVITALKEVASKSSTWAVITDKAYKEEAGRIFETPLVFTPEEIKGLEYDSIILYSLLDNEIFYHINTNLSDESISNRKNEEKVNRPKKGEGEAEYGPPLNQLFTAITRTTGELIFVQKKARKLEKLIQALHEGLPENLTGQPVHIGAQIESTEVDWEKEANRLLLHGDSMKAKAIYLNKLHKTESEFSEFSINFLIQNNKSATIPSIITSPSLHQNIKERKQSELLRQSMSSAKSHKKDKATVGNISDTRLKQKLTVIPETLAKGKNADESEKMIFSTPLLFACQSGNFEAVKTLLTRGVAVDKPDAHGITPLFAASQLGYIKIVEILLAQKANVDKASIDDVTPLYIASEEGQLEVVQLLLSHGAAINRARRGDGVTPLIVAAQQGHSGIVEILLKSGANINLESKVGILSPLYMASQNGHIEVIKILLDQGAEIDLSNERGLTPLMAAVKEGHIEIVKILLARGAVSNKIAKDGQTPLICANQNGHAEIVQILLDYGAQVDLPMNNSISPLLMASYRGDIVSVQKLLDRGAQINQVDKEGATALVIAAHNGHAEIARILLDREAKINQANKEGATALFMASQNGQAEIVKILLAHGAEINLVNNLGATALYMASQIGHAGIVKMLLDHNALIDLTLKGGSRPLSVASHSGHITVVKLLLDHGAQVNLENEEGKTPLFMAFQRKHTAIMKMLLDHGAESDLAMTNGNLLFMACADGDIISVQILLDHGAKINLRINNEVTPMMIASHSGHISVIKLLLKRGAQVNLANNNGETPLYLAVEENHFEIVKMLLDHGAHTDLAQNNGATPLFLASQDGHIEIVKILLAQGAEINQAMNDGVTPLFMACYNGHIEIVKMLLEHGAMAHLESKNGTTPLVAATMNNHKKIANLLLPYLKQPLKNQNQKKVKSASDKSDQQFQKNSHLTQKNRYPWLEHTQKEISEQQIKNTSSDVKNTQILQQPASFLLENKKFEPEASSFTLNTIPPTSNTVFYVSRARQIVEILELFNTDNTDVALRRACAGFKKGELSNNTFNVLVEHANINSQSTKEGKTALHWAVEKGHLDYVNILIKFGADTSIRDFDGKAASAYTNNAEIKKILESRARESLGQTSQLMPAF